MVLAAVLGGHSNIANSAVASLLAEPAVIPKASISMYISPRRITTSYLRSIKAKGRALGTDLITPDADGRTFPYKRATAILQLGYQEKRSNAGTTTGCYGSSPPASCRWGTVLQNRDDPWYPNAKLRAVVLAFAQGFFYGTRGNPDVFLSIVPGTKNDGHVDYAAGKSWADEIVDRLNADFRNRPVGGRFKFSQQMHVNGGCDCELAFETAEKTNDWILGYKENLGGSALIDYGDCAGCDYTEPYDPAMPLARNWTIPKIYERLMAHRRSRIIPQIYNELGNNARSWGLLAKWVWNEHGQKLIFRGSLSQRRAIDDCNLSDPGAENPPDQSYRQLWKALNDSAWAGYSIPAQIRTSLRYSTNITWHPC